MVAVPTGELIDGEHVNIADRKRRNAVFIASLGNFVAWYDFYVYAEFSLALATVFFPKDDAPVLSQALLLAGYLFRPFGAWGLGYLADRYGRRLPLALAVFLTCLSSLVICAWPGGQSYWAWILFFVARALQGAAVGAEYGISATYVTEVAEKDRRGFYGSFLYVTLIGGMAAAILVRWLVGDPLPNGGWRIPFLIGGMLGVGALVLPSMLPETKASDEANGVVNPAASIAALLKHPREILLVTGLGLGGTAAFYAYTHYAKMILQKNLGNDDHATMVLLGSLVFALILQPIYGAIADRIGHKWILVSFGVVGVWGTYPILTTLQQPHDAITAFLCLAAAWIFLSGYTSVNAVVKAEVFPAEIRALGVGVCHAAVAAPYGGTMDWVADLFGTRFSLYVTVMILLSLITVSVLLRDTVPSVVRLPDWSQAKGHG